MTDSAERPAGRPGGRPWFDALAGDLGRRTPNPETERVLAVVVGWLTDNELEWDQTGPSSFSFGLPGERKLQTPVRLDIGAHVLGVHAFVCRRPDENHEGVYRWLLQRNLKTYAAAFAIDAVGDIYLDGRLPLAAVTADELDRLLGAVLSTADESFNTLLELGFATSIRKEWNWRRLRGESTRNLDAFRGWLEAGDTAAAAAAASSGRVPDTAP